MTDNNTTDNQLTMFSADTDKGCRMLHDGESYYPNSCVYWTRFKSFELQQLFAYLREREQILRTDILKSDGPLKALYIAQMRQVQSTLIWMVQHATGMPREIELRREGLW